MKYLILFFAAIAILNLAAYSQVDTAEYNKMRREYDDFIKTESAKFEKYKEDRDREFSEFLKKDWENYKLFADNKPISLPGPDKIPVFDKKRESVQEKKIPTKKITEIALPPSEEQQMTFRPIPKPELPASKADYDLASFDYYGSKAYLIYHKKLQSCKISNVNEAQIADFWETASGTDYYRLVEQLLEYRNQYNLNDYAYLKLVEKVAAQIHKSDNDSKLLSWFLLSKSGYKVKVGYFGSNIYLLIPVVNTIYSYSYFVLENLKYYIFEDQSKPSNIYTYKHNYPEANRIMNFNIYKAPILGNDVLKRSLEFNYNNKNYKFDIDYNKNLIDFYSDYPQGEIQIFFNAGMSHNAKESLDRNLDSLVSTMSEIDAANFLLNFTQVAFEYQTDQEQFGHEKFFFPEEIFHYAAADCEDRSVFFAFLINEYMRLPVAGISYPGHIATAVKFNENVAGAHFVINDEKFVICDPTYINAPVGASMPEFQKSDATIIRLKNYQSGTQDENHIWKKLKSKGYAKTNYEENIIQIDENYWFVTGLLGENPELPKGFEMGNSDIEHLFIAKVDNDANIISLTLLRCNGLLVPIAIAHSKDVVYLSGYYSENMSLGQQKISSPGSRELFMAAFDINLENLWLRNSGIVHEQESSNVFFAANFDKKGNYLGFDKISEQSYELQNSIDASSNEKIVFYGKTDGSESMSTKSETYNSSNVFGYAKKLKELTDEFVAKNYEKSCAGLFAFLTILQNDETQLLGNEILAAVNASNSEFKTKYPELYSTIKSIKNVTSKNGIIKIRFNTSDRISIGAIIFEPEISFRIQNFKSGNIEIIVMSGILYKPYFKSTPINFLKLFKTTGDITIDYDSDNDQKVINISKDLLK
jgi:hypothetical protein